MAINALIIDDETSSREALHNLLVSHKGTIQITGEANGVESGVKLIMNCKPDLVFLDIEMPDGTGFDLLKQLPDPEFEVIFITAYDGYALQAFKFSAIDYLLKPVAREDLARAIEVARQRRVWRQPVRKANINVLIENYESGHGKMRKLVLPDNDGFLIKPIDEIVFLQGERNYTRLFFSNKESFLSSYTLLHFEELLNGCGFFRVFKSHIVNLSHIVRYSKTYGGTVTMTGGAEIPVSPAKKEELKKLFL